MLLLSLLFNLFPAYIPLFLIIFCLLTICIDAALILDNRSPEDTLAWIFFFLLFPIIGWVFFLLIGRHQRNFFSRREMLAKQKIGHELTAELESLQAKEKERIQQIQQKFPDNKSRLLQLAQTGLYSFVTTNNSLKILQNATSKYPCLLDDIDTAEHTVHLQYFEWSEDEFTNRLKILLIKKSQQGVKVRILIDALGHNLSKSYRNELQENGVEIYIYYKYQSLFSFHTINYRNHRKIAVIDGKIGYVGGINMGQSYLDGGEAFERWRDTHVRIEGEAVAVLQGIFITSWYNTTEEKLTESKYFPTTTYQSETATCPIQITTSGPDSDWQLIKQLYFAMVLDAQKCVYIQSPFFIPDQSFMEALSTAALSGVTVKLMIAADGPDHNIPYWSANTYFAELAKAGVEIYLYTAGYLHAKTINIDHTVCCIGSVNIDIRSFSIDYEVTAVIYDERIAQQLADDFLADIDDCDPFDLEAYQSRSRLVHLRDSTARLFSPLL